MSKPERAEEGSAKDASTDPEEVKVVVTPLLWVLGILCLLIGLGGGVVFSMMSLAK